MQFETITITKVINSGYGVAHLDDGKVVLVRHLLPGETATVTIEEKKKNLLYGKVHQLVQNHSRRRAAPCKYYGECGGCDMQLCDYNTQLNIKEGILRDLLLGQPSDTVREAAEIVAAPKSSPEEFGYRQRIRLQIDSENRFAFRRFRSHDIIPIDRCLLAHPNINSCISELLHHTVTAKITALTSELEIQVNPVSEKIVCIFHFSRKPRPADVKNAIEICGDIPLIESIFFTGESFQLHGPVRAGNDGTGRTMTLHYPQLNSTSTPLTLTWEVGGFCQVNIAQNGALIDTVADFCNPLERDSVLDLFCGMGNFSIPLATLAKELTGFEGQGSAIRSAKTNATAAGLSNTSFYKSPVHTACAELVAKNTEFDCVVIDPPRQGAPELAHHLATLCRKRMVYISCDPTTLCRDLVKLTEEGFGITRIQPIDMFPQTHHIETVVLLER